MLEQDLTLQGSELPAATSREVASLAYQQYLSAPSDASAGLLLWHEDRIDKNVRSSYQLAAGSCVIQAALHPEAEYGLEDRLSLIRRATLYWDRAYEQEEHTSNDIAERAKWANCQLPTFEAIAIFIEEENIDYKKVQVAQEGRFREHLSFLLKRWPHENLDGHAMEVLTSYFPHRSNRMRPNELPVYNVPSSLYHDYHPEANRRVDVDTYDLREGVKYGIQVKGSNVSNPDERGGSDHQLHRIFFRNARRHLCLPQTEGSLRRTIEAIVSDDPRYRNDLDTIAADTRARITRHFDLPRYVGTSILKTK